MPVVDRSVRCRSRTRRWWLRVPLASLAALALAPSSAAAHDFWLIPGLFGFSSRGVVEVSGRQGTRFPNGRPVRADQIARARILGATSDVAITEMAVEGNSLVLRQRPTADGQYLVVAALTPRTSRAPAAGFVRFLRLEGGAAEAARLERDSALTGIDTVAYTSSMFAATTVQVGSRGPRAFARTAGLPLEFVPVNDPGQLRAGDTLTVRVLGGGSPVAGIGIDATPAMDSTTTAATSPMVSLHADATGTVHVPLTIAGPWMLRAAYVAHHAGGARNEFDLSRSTYVFSVAPRP